MSSLTDREDDDTYYQSSDDTAALVQPVSSSDHDIDIEEFYPVKASAYSAWFNITNVTVGAGTLSIPFAIQKVGLILGIFLVVFMGVLADVSLRLLLWTADLTDATSFQRVAEVTYGSKCVKLVDITVVALCFACVLSYTILIGDLIPPVIRSWSGTNNDETSREFIMGMVLVFIILPLSLAKTLDFLRHTSLLAMLCMLYLMFVVIIWAGTNDFNDINRGNIDKIDPVPTATVTYGKFTEQIFFAIPIIAFAYSSHIQVYQIYREMGTKNLPRMMNIVHLSVASCATLYLSVGIFGYLTFYDALNGNIFNNYTVESNIAISLGKIGLSITLICSAPLFMLPLRSTIEQLFCPIQSRIFSWVRHIGLTVSVLALAYLLAVFIPQVADVLSLTGATASGAVMYLFPAVFYLKLEGLVPDIKTPAATRRRWAAYFILGWGIVVAITGTVISIIGFAG